MSKPVLLAFCALLGAATSGCAWSALGPAWLPVALENAPKGAAGGRPVVVSLVRSTGWFPYAEMESKPHPHSQVRVEAVTALDPAKPVVLMPYHLAACGFMLGLMINEDPELITFAPGCEPGGRVQVTVNGAATNWAYRQAAYWKDAALVIALLPSTPSPPPKTQAGHWARIKDLLADEGLWRELRAWYSWGRSRAEVTTICRCVLDDVGSLDALCPHDPWTPALQDTLDWCRKVAQSG